MIQIGGDQNDFVFFSGCARKSARTTVRDGFLRRDFGKVRVDLVHRPLHDQLFKCVPPILSQQEAHMIMTPPSRQQASAVATALGL